MRTPVRGYAARRRFLGLSPAALSVIAILVIFAGLAFAGVISPMKWFRSSKPDRRGLIPIPVAAMPIQAYTRVTRDHLWNSKAGELSFIYLRPDQVNREMIRSINGVIGRVVNHDKQPNYVFTEDDFEPKGTRPGLVAGIPAGKRAMRIPVDRIPGLVGLQPGDRFDLVATAPIDAGGAAAAMGSGIYAKQLELQARLSNWQKQATVRVVVQNGDIVDGMRTRTVPVASNTMTSGLIVRTKPVQEVVIAVKPTEVARLTEAMAVGEDIACVPRSGRPEDPHESLTPDSMPVSPFGGPAPRLTREPSDELSSTASSSTPSTGGTGVLGHGFTTIETINGTKREMVGAPVR